VAKKRLLLTLLPEEAYPSQLKKQNPEKLTLEFEKGHLIKINDKNFLILRKRL
jgi:argininosuccinate synthase